MTAKIHPEADAELLAAAQWYENQSGGLGGQFLDELFETIRSIEQHPGRFGKSRQRTSREVRQAALSRFPYLVVYEVREQHCLVVAIAHAHRRPGYWRNRLS
jgi:hypothetical protein